MHHSPFRHWKVLSCASAGAAPSLYLFAPLLYLSAMTSSRPYLIRAIHEWIVDNFMTPYLLVDIEGEGVNVPRQHGQNGKIVLNVSPQAVDGLLLSNEAIAFRARFGGIATDVYVPVDAVLAIYARENGRGMVFTEDEDEPGPDAPGKPGGGRPRLKVVK
jgi:stringent starvation protein B